MKEIIIRYKDSRVLEVLKSLAKYFDFSISETKESNQEKKKAVFTVLHVDGKGYKFDREEANDR